MIAGRLLILDDDEAVARTIALIAEGLGLHARTTTRCAELLAEIDRWQPTHLAIDLVMPEMDGVEVLRLLASRGCRARVIITSGVGSRVLESARRAAAEHGLDIVGVLSKPFVPSTLRVLLEAPPARAAAPGPARGAPRESLVVDEAELRRALDRREFLLAYQPKIECASGALAGFEALVRWNHPRAGLVMPDRFVPVAESLGLIDALTEQVFDQSLEWFSHAFAQSDIGLSVNLSARSLADFALSNRIRDLCRQHGVEPARVIIELTETSTMADPTTSLDLLTRMRMQGFQLSIDDFGTGYSSMLQLVRLPFSEMKIDKSFVMTATQSPESRAVVKSIVDLGHSLGLGVVAEGVEDERTLDFLRDVGCDLAQGYFVARAMAGHTVAAWSERWEAARASQAPPARDAGADGGHHSV